VGPELDAQGRVDAHGRLVEEEHLGLVHERAREREPAAHAAGELQRGRPLPSAQLDEVEDVLDRRLVRVPQEAGEEAEVLADRQLRIDRLGLGHVADPRERLPRRHLRPEDPRLAARRAGET